MKEHRRTGQAYSNNFDGSLGVGYEISLSSTERGYSEEISRVADSDM